MQPDAVSDQLPSTVMPDYCNTGVIFRALLAVNAALLAACLVHTHGWISGALAFAEASVPVELICLVSLFALCALRRLLLQTGAMRALSPWSQRMLCALLPAWIAGMVVRILVAFDWFYGSFGFVSPAEGMLIAGLAAYVLQHYFELRARAFSPALAEAKLQALQARIRPHFLFNSLNAVLSLIRSEPRRAEEALEDMADLFRVAMRDARALTPLEDEIHLCRQYLSLEQIRLGERLRVEWDTSGIGGDDLRTGLIASLLLQPLVENAVHYGVEPVAEPAPVTVRIAKSMDRIEILVANSLTGNPPPNLSSSTGNQMALGNIRARLALLYDVEAQLDYGARDGRFEVRLSYPFSRRAAA
ncbi:MAG: histidine kinase [Burkholderiaceae bacterium]|nr:histidine kinase [Burkholderiaceae bacterium]